MGNRAGTIRISSDGTVVADPPASARLARRPGTFELVAEGDSVLALRRCDGPGHGPILMAGQVCQVLGVADVAAAIAQLGLRGQLVVTQGEHRRTFGLAQGALKAAASNVPEERLGAIMVRHGALTAAQLQRCLTRMDGRRLGEVALQERMLDSDRLFELLCDQAKLAFQSSILATEGHYQFERMPDDAPFDSPFNMHLPIQGLLMECLQRSDEMQVFRKRIPDGDALPLMTAKAAHVAVPPSLRPVAALADGSHSVFEIGSALELDEFETTRAVHRLLQAGLVELAANGKPMAGQCHRTVVRFNGLLSEVSQALQAHAPDHGLAGSTRAWLRRSPFAELFDGALEADGSLAVEPLIARLERTTTEAQRLPRLLSALHELASYTVFAASVHLPGPAEAALSRAVQRRLAELTE